MLAMIILTSLLNKKTVLSSVSRPQDLLEEMN